MNLSLYDTHCHLDLEPLRSELTHIMNEANIAGVTAFVVPGVHPNGWPGIAALAEEYLQILPAFGIHPMHAECVTDDILESLSTLSAKGIAIGEIGLDPAYPAPMHLQEVAFRQQLRIAVHLGLPVLIHCRHAFRQMLTILREEHADQVGGIMHAFSGSLEMARDFIRLGFAISVSGAITWDNAVKPLRLVSDLAIEHLVLETDAPDMTPQRYRGVFNRPAWIRETALRVAEIRGLSIEEVALITTDNALRVLHLHA